MRTLISGLLAFTLAACSAAPAPARPAIWKVADPDTTIYLFGTVHVLPPRIDWQTPRLKDTLASADELVLEIADQDDKQQMAATFAGLAISPGLPPLADRLPADRRAKLDALLAKAGLKPGQLDMLETWAAAVTLGSAVYAGMGMTVENGVERQLTRAFKDNGKDKGKNKRIDGLETTAQQLGYFDTLDEATQRELLTSIVDDSDKAAADFDQMITAWSRGDVKAIAETFDNELRRSPELAEVLLDRRNANWVGWLRERMDRPGTVVVAVGAGHLAGKGSVIERLEAAGLRVERVQ